MTALYYRGAKAAIVCYGKLHKIDDLQPSTQAFYPHSLDLAQIAMTSGDVTKFRAKLNEREENAWVLG